MFTWCFFFLDFLFKHLEFLFYTDTNPQMFINVGVFFMKVFLNDNDNADWRQADFKLVKAASQGLQTVKKWR